MAGDEEQQLDLTSAEELSQCGVTKLAPTYEGEASGTTQFNVPLHRNELTLQCSTFLSVWRK